ncbi:BTB/POZ domain-containing protein [Ditylenchus destructor]|uniref:BTB/POZ domain-containing protein n=1 Tax=Ditylenchus destructor TaxID=166010 RepID=A0AAD4MZW1_9BILA|nr:BTB/POZ domain-containing protein [Ditylenchus destructor]
MENNSWVAQPSRGFNMNGINLMQSIDGNATFPSTSRVSNAAGDSRNECFTDWQPLVLRQEWTISNFQKALELATPGTCMRSRTFKDETMPEICWQLCLYPGGKREENVGHVSLFLKMSTTHSNREFTVRAEYRFYFVDDAGAARFSNVNTGDFKVKPSKGSHSWGLRNIPRQKVLNCIRSDSSLHIVCQIELVPDFSKLTTRTMPDRKCDTTQLTKEYLDRIHKMFETGEGSDCVIECQNRQFHVHKFVLMAHSEVFRAMFSHKDTLENIESRIKMTDTNPTAVHQMLTYMYSGGLPDGFADDHAPALIEISEKYGLDPLKILCQDKLISRLTPANVCGMLVLADVHNADLLMSACIPIIKNNFEQLRNCEDWDEIKSTNPKLVNNVLEKVLTYDNAPPPQKKIRLQEMFYRT